VLGLIRRYLGAGIVANGVVVERHEGRGHAFVRYADDCNVYVRSRRAGERVMETLRRLYAKLRLRINESKSAVARPWDRKFLGFSFWVAPGREVKRRVASKALVAMKQRVRSITGRSRGRSIPTVVAELRGYLVGWKEYFRLADTPKIFRELDEWISHRLRAIQLKQWKRGTTIFRELRARGLSAQAAAKVAGNARSWWRSSGMTINIALPRSHYEGLGLPRLAT
jgi:RNA-directed DNA polymerase